MRAKQGWLWWALLITSPTLAQTHGIDSACTSASFWARPVWLKRIHGVFPVVEGEAYQQPETGLFRVDARIDVRALQMTSAAHLTWAQSEEFFHIARHPWIHFHAEAVDPRTLAQGQPLSGTITLRGITKDIKFLLESAECDNPGLDCSLLASGEIRRSDFGMDRYRLTIGDTIHLEFSVCLKPRSDSPN